MKKLTGILCLALAACSSPGPVRSEAPRSGVRKFVRFEAGGEWRYGMVEGDRVRVGFDSDDAIALRQVVRGVATLVHADVHDQVALHLSRNAAQVSTLNC